MTDVLPNPNLTAGAVGAAPLCARLKHWRMQGLTVGLVPTMGALHGGHLSLIDIARAHADRVVASIFVNPKQFAPGEDFDAYPRKVDADANALAQRGCHVLYAPNGQDMYPDGFCTTISLAGPAQGLESDTRPHFFSGVATVVTKLFNTVRPDVAVFGEKDYQQLLVIRRLAADLDTGVTVLAAPIMREQDGLAMSSRNAYLSAADRTTAPALYATLCHAAKALRGGVHPDVVEDTARQALVRAGFTSVDYVALRHGDTLGAVTQEQLNTVPVPPLRLLGAANLGAVRLIDTIRVDWPETGPETAPETGP